MKLALVHMAEVRDIKPPLGLASLATYLERYMDYKNTKIIDPTYGDIKEQILQYKPNIVGISSMTFEYKDAIDFAKFIKKKLNVPIIIGGVHISSCIPSFQKCFDIGVIGEGEETLLELIQHFKTEGKFNKNKLKDIDGLIFYDENNTLIKTNSRAPIRPLDKIPIPNRKYVNPKYFEKHYTIGLAKQVKEATMLTSRGCPYRCSFCSTSIFWGNAVRYHSAKQVFQEMKMLVKEYNVTHFDIWDDLFTINKKRLEELGKLIEEGGLKNKITISCQARANLVNDKLCELMKKINIKSISMGFESGSEKIIKELKGANVTVEDNKKAIITLKKHGFRVLGSLIFASPKETIKDMKNSLEFIDFAIKNKADTLYSFIMTPLPGTPVWETAKQRGKVSDKMWDESNINSKGNPFNMDNESKTYERPLLLDKSVDVEEFKKVFFEARKKLNIFRYKFIINSILNSPFDTAKYILKNPKNTIKSIIGILKGNK